MAKKTARTTPAAALIAAATTEPTSAAPVAPAADQIPAGSPAVDLQSEGLPTEVVASEGPVTPLAVVDPTSPTPPPPAPVVTVPPPPAPKLPTKAEILEEFSGLTKEALLEEKAHAEAFLDNPGSSDAATIEGCKFCLQVLAELLAPVRKFYHALNSNRYIRHGGFQFSFAAYQHVGGTWMGTFATSVVEEIKALDELVEKKMLAVTALTPEEYDDCQKKKVVAFHLSGQSMIQLGDQSRSSQPSANLAEPLNSEPAAPAPAAPPVQSAADALTVGKVEAPPA